MNISQKSLVRLMELMGQADTMIKGVSQRTYWSRLVYEYDFPDRFIEITETNYSFNWDRIIRDLRRRSFFFSTSGRPLYPTNALKIDEIREAAEFFLEKLTAIAVIRIAPQYSLDADQLMRSIENDGFTLNTDAVQLVATEGHVSLAEEEGLLEKTIRESRLPRATESLKHLKDAGDQYLDGNKDHPSLNESRCLFQSLVDQICEEVDRTGKSSKGLPGPMKSRLDYLEANGVWTNDQRMMFGAAWGFLSAGGHPGLTPREEARIGRLLSIEFSSVLILSWYHWKQPRP